MKYENGEIITVKVEEKKKSNISDIIDLDDRLPEIDINNTTESSTIDSSHKEDVTQGSSFLSKINFKTLMKIFTSGIFKFILGTFIIGFFVYSFYDAYDKFIAPTSNKTDVNNQITEINTNNTQDNNDEVTNINDEPKESPLKLALRTANVTNVVMVQESNKELQKLNEYMDNKTNKASTENTINKHFNEKRKMYLLLVSSKPLFEDENIMDFYIATENRLLNSLKFSQSIIEIFENSEGRAKLKEEIELFLTKEDILAEAQHEELIKILDKRNIDYKVHPDSNAIEYKIE